jgi:hypothetical protein
VSVKSSVVKFRSKIYVIGINPVVDPPERVLRAIFAEAGKDKGPIPVRGTINGAEFSQTLVKYAGAWRLYINGIMLKDSGTALGERIKVEIEFDPRPRDVPINVELAAALKENKTAKRAFESLAPSRQKEILRYIGSLKSIDTIAKNVDRVISQLSGSDEDPPAFMRKR